MQRSKTDIPSTEKDKLSPVETIRFEMSNSVKALASPCEPGESIKSCVRRVAMRTGLTFGQVRRLWYAEWNVIPAHVADKLREASEHHDRLLKANMLRAVAAMQESDPDFYRDQIEAMGLALFHNGNGTRQAGIQD